MNQGDFDKFLQIYGNPIFSADLDVEVNNICRSLETFHIDNDNYKQYKLCKGKGKYCHVGDDCKLLKTTIYTKYVVNNIDLNCPYNLDWLSKHIRMSYYRDCQKMPTFKKKCKVVRYIERILRLMESRSFIFLTGSTITNLGDDSSDVDICWIIPGYGINNLSLPYDMNLNYINGKLHETKRFLLKFLNQMKVIEGISVIESKVPLLQIQFNEKWFNIEVDISINNLPGAMNSKLLHYYSGFDLRFSQLVLFFKNFCKASGYKDAHNNYLNSYSISLMVLHFLQVIVEPPILPNLQQVRPDIFSNYKLLWFPYFQNIILPPLKTNRMSLSELYVKFLQYFGKFDSKYYGISISKGCLLPRALFIKNNRNYPLFIEEPFEKENTARSLKLDRWIDIKRNMLEEVNCLFRKSKSV
uniref:PAP-associated domain-containing protein n=1 Tax=Strongyloides stercoralis TaxID=6248 RepID=A0AAF5D6E8_STRER